MNGGDLNSMFQDDPYVEVIGDHDDDEVAGVILWSEATDNTVRVSLIQTNLQQGNHQKVDSNVEPEEQAEGVTVKNSTDLIMGEPSNNSQSDGLNNTLTLESMILDQEDQAEGGTVKNSTDLIMGEPSNNSQSDGLKNTLTLESMILEPEEQAEGVTVKNSTDLIMGEPSNNSKSDGQKNTLPVEIITVEHKSEFVQKEGHFYFSLDSRPRDKKKMNKSDVSTLVTATPQTAVAEAKPVDKNPNEPNIALATATAKVALPEPKAGPSCKRLNPQVTLERVPLETLLSPEYLRECLAALPYSRHKGRYSLRKGRFTAKEYGGSATPQKRKKRKNGQSQKKKPK